MITIQARVTGAALAAALAGCGGVGQIQTHDDGRCRDAVLDLGPKRVGGQCPHPDQRVEVLEKAGAIVMVCRCPATDGSTTVRELRGVGR